MSPASSAYREPRITIITPSYNQARFLRRCIDSVLDQRWPNLEYWVLDGGSADGSRAILESYGDRIRWRSCRDGGQAAAINEGLAAATGDIVAWINSDDYYLPGAFASVVRALDESPEACGVHARAWIVDEDGRRIRPYPSLDVTRENLRARCAICQPTVFLRREVVARVGPLNPALALCLDYEWWLRILRHERLAFQDEVVAASRHHPRTKTAARRSRALIEAGYVLRHHFGGASWHWAARWAAHRYRHGRGSALVRAFKGAVGGAAYYRRFSSNPRASGFGKDLLSGLEGLRATPPALPDTPTGPAPRDPTLPSLDVPATAHAAPSGSRRSSCAGKSSPACR